MPIETTKKLFTVDEYYRMAQVGILRPEDRVELIDGQIIEMSPIGDRHAGCVNATTHAFNTAFQKRAVVSVQNPVRLNRYTEAQPDVVLLKPRKDFYRGKRVDEADVFLIVEVAETTLRYDREVKVPRYAAAGVPEVWIEDLQKDLLLVYRDPEGHSYRTSLTLKREESIAVLALPDVTFKVLDFIG